MIILHKVALSYFKSYIIILMIIFDNLLAADILTGGLSMIFNASTPAKLQCTYFLSRNGDTLRRQNIQLYEQ